MTTLGVLSIFNDKDNKGGLEGHVAVPANFLEPSAATRNRNGGSSRGGVGQGLINSRSNGKIPPARVSIEHQIEDPPKGRSLTK